MPQLANMNNPRAMMRSRAGLAGNAEEEGWETVVVLELVLARSSRSRVLAILHASS
jgi:hypothetical protein